MNSEKLQKNKRSFGNVQSVYEVKGNKAKVVNSVNLLLTNAKFEGRVKSSICEYFQMGKKYVRNY